VLYKTKKSDFSVQHGKLFVDIESGNVGIGTEQPEAKIHLQEGSLKLEDLKGEGNRYVCVDNDGLIFASDTACR
jgi:hypothetical protein